MERIEFWARVSGEWDAPPWVEDASMPVPWCWSQWLSGRDPADITDEEDLPDVDLAEFVTEWRRSIWAIEQVPPWWRRLARAVRAWIGGLDR